MLTNEQFMQKLEAEKDNVAIRIAEAIIQRGAGQYINVPVAQIKKSVMPSIEMMLEYFRTGDSAKIKTEIQERTASRLKQGVSAENLQLVTEITANILEQTIETISGEDKNNDSTLAKYKGRVENIKALTKVNIVHNKLQQDV